jgi:hypothetical protein
MYIRENESFPFLPLAPRNLHYLVHGRGSDVSTTRSSCSGRRTEGKGGRKEGRKDRKVRSIEASEEALNDRSIQVSK